MRSRIDFHKFVPGLLILLAYSSTLYAQVSPSRTSFFNETWLNAVVSIEFLKDGKRNPVGTGFLVNTPQKRIALVTAAHVIRDDKGILRSGLLYRRSDRPSDDTISETDLLRAGLGEWLFSSTHDLAVRLIGWRGSSTPPTIPFDAFVEESLLNVGAPLLILGFPTGLQSTTHEQPIARPGMIARSGRKGITIESFVFPGNSGGPAVYVPTLRVGNGLMSPLLNTEGLVGVISSYIPYQEVAISPQTGRTRIIFEENSGLASIIPAQFIKKLIDSPEFLKRENALSK